MKNVIIIIIECDNTNLIYTSIIESTKKKILAYFGKKFVLCNESYIPSIVLSCDIDMEDITNIKKEVDNDFIQFLVIKNIESNCIAEDTIITLPK